MISPQTIQVQISPTEAATLAAEAIKELVDLKYCNIERWTRIFPADHIPAQARRDGERRALLLAVAKMLEDGV